MDDLILRIEALTAKPDKPTVPEALPLVNAFFERGGNTSGGNLHIVLEDPNYKDRHVQYCLELATRENDLLGAALAKLLLRMSQTQRKAISMRHTY